MVLVVKQPSLYYSNVKHSLRPFRFAINLSDGFQCAARREKKNLYKADKITTTFVPAKFKIRTFFERKRV